jgi:HlyD family secretion protein
MVVMSAELQKLRIDKSQKARRKERHIWPWALLVVALAGGAAGAWKFQQGTAAVEVETLHVRVPESAATGAAGDLVVLNATGYIIAAHKIELASKVVGRVAWIGVEMGDKIEKDQVLVKLEDDEYKARVMQQQGLLDNAKAKLAELEAGTRPQEIAQMQAQVAGAEAEAANAALNYQRVLAVRQVQRPAEVDDAEALMKVRQAQAESMRQQLALLKAGTRKEQIAAQVATVRQLEGSLANAALDLQNTVIRAPISGTVLERNVEVGEFVTNGFVGDRGAKGYVVSLADLNDLLVELDISQNNFAQVTSSGKCWIVTDAYPDVKYEGAVERISPLANRQKATVLVRVKVLNPDERLRPEMNATVSFLSPAAASQKAGVAAGTQASERPPVRVPSSAVHEGVVFVVEDGKARRVAVTTGLRSASGELEVKKGLIGGEELIVSPPEGLKDGDAVKMKSE